MCLTSVADITFLFLSAWCECKMQICTCSNISVCLFPHHHHLHCIRRVGAIKYGILWGEEKWQLFTSQPKIKQDDFLWDHEIHSLKLLSCSGPWHAYEPCAHDILDLALSNSRTLWILHFLALFPALSSSVSPAQLSSINVELEPGALFLLSWAFRVPWVVWPDRILLSVFYILK